MLVRADRARSSRLRFFNEIKRSDGMIGTYCFAHEASWDTLFFFDQIRKIMYGLLSIVSRGSVLGALVSPNRSPRPLFLAAVVADFSSQLSSIHTMECTLMP